MSELVNSPREVVAASFGCSTFVYLAIHITRLAVASVCVCDKKNVDLEALNSEPSSPSSTICLHSTLSSVSSCAGPYIPQTPEPSTAT